jgi:hypothetical protein
MSSIEVRLLPNGVRQRWLITRQRGAQRATLTAFELSKMEGANSAAVIRIGAIQELQR